MSGHIDVPPSLYTITPRTLAELQQLVAEQLQDGTTCFVTDQNALYIYRNTTPVAAVLPPVVVATARGVASPGRWLQASGVVPNDGVPWNVTNEFNAVGSVTSAVAIPAATPTMIFTASTTGGIPVPNVPLLLKALATVQLTAVADSEVTLQWEYKGSSVGTWSPFGAAETASVAAGKNVMAALSAANSFGFLATDSAVAFRLMATATTAASAQKVNAACSVGV